MAGSVEEQAGLHCMLMSLLIVFPRSVLFHDEEEYTELDH
jgi:hypothetical protein